MCPIGRNYDDRRTPRLIVEPSFSTTWAGCLFFGAHASIEMQCFGRGLTNVADEWILSFLLRNKVCSDKHHVRGEYVVLYTFHV